MDPKLKYEIVPGRRPYIADEDREAFLEERRRMNAADEQDGTNAFIDAPIAEEVEPED